ncbi:hypothetical protein [Mesohalobacter halotolerans]|uniref:Uncharacterized protein n=1 Tax=Mesohalobacter halotolerans TaxID=1883405 RepID=A0A4U5TPT9_9FLAO|nr:hypothetical protein [Mesohalobacter halotolerans]MBS3738910.1 hypothetical protein [Psychroflexus sp.]TKS55741.1 hypothetical protein FCN74_10575 [Mesohalobacter halotolerans]
MSPSTFKLILLFISTVTPVKTSKLPTVSSAVTVGFTAIVTSAPVVGRVLLAQFVLTFQFPSFVNMNSVTSDSL